MTARIGEGDRSREGYGVVQGKGASGPYIGAEEGRSELGVATGSHEAGGYECHQGRKVGTKPVARGILPRLGWKRKLKTRSRIRKKASGWPSERPIAFFFGFEPGSSPPISKPSSRGSFDLARKLNGLCIWPETRFKFFRAWPKVRHEFGQALSLSVGLAQS